MTLTEATPWPGDDDTKPRPEAVPATTSWADRPFLPTQAGAARYVTERVLGAGGMGEVREATDPLLSRRVAMKVMHPEVARTEDGYRRFLREARVQGQLEHPAVVPVYDLGQDADGLPYFTMKQVRGLTLEQVLAGLADGDPAMQARFPRRRLLTAFVQVCLAIDFAHSRAVLHRDLKPGNIMLGDFGDVHVLDWGLAQVGKDRGPAHDLEAALAQATRGGSVFGTPGFMPPEQIRGDVLSPAADVYALGAVLFELLTLKPLHDGLAMARLEATLKGAPRSPSLAAPEAKVPAELDAAVLAATRADPAQRTATARELAETVERYLDGDRDQALRRELAARHLAAARPLVEQLEGSSGEQRETALQQLSGALALDPGNAEGLELLGRLITFVPEQLPAEVEAVRQEAEGVARASLSRAVALRMCMWLALVPLVWSLGPRDATLAGSIVASVVAALGLAAWGGRQERLSRTQLGVVMVATGLALSGVSLIFGAFVLAPVLASTFMLMFASHLGPKLRTLTIGIGLCIVVGPLVAEQFGVLAPAVEVTLDQLRISSRVLHFPPELTKLVLAISTLSALAMPGVLGGQLRDRLAHAEKKLFLMAWHLERLGQR